jgi:hypothetical protein
MKLETSKPLVTGESALINPEGGKVNKQIGRCGKMEDDCGEKICPLSLWAKREGEEPSGKADYLVTAGGFGDLGEPDLFFHPVARGCFPFHGAVDQLMHLVEPPRGAVGATLALNDARALVRFCQFEFHLLVCHKLPFVILRKIYGRGLDIGCPTPLRGLKRFYFV